MEKLIKIQIKTWLGKLIFEYESTDNTIKETLLEAIKFGADLSDANLRRADLSGADLRRADLSGADLSGADLSGADLRRAENKETACLPIFCKWTPCIIGNDIKIGCKQMTIENWDLFFASNEEFETKRGTDEFNHIEAVYLAYKAYLTHLSK